MRDAQQPQRTRERTVPKKDPGPFASALLRSMRSLRLPKSPQSKIKIQKSFLRSLQLRGLYDCCGVLPHFGFYAHSESWEFRDFDSSFSREDRVFQHGRPI